MRPVYFFAFSIATTIITAIAYATPASLPEFKVRTLLRQTLCDPSGNCCLEPQCDKSGHCRCRPLRYRMQPMKPRQPKSYRYKTSPHRFGSRNGPASGGYAEVLPTRMFAGPGQFPPKQFKAYGIVAFNTLPAGTDKARYRMICEAYLSGLIHYSATDASLEDQMVTVWPIDTAKMAKKINAEARKKVCGDAVAHYGLAIAQHMIADAKKNIPIPHTRGPFLLAWSPGSAEGEQGVVVIFSDMTNVVNQDQAKDIFISWADDIQKNPELWERGWNIEKLRNTIRLWADRWGPQILKATGLSQEKPR